MHTKAFRKSVTKQTDGPNRKPSFKIRYIARAKQEKLRFKDERGPAPLDKEPMPHAVQVAVEQDLFQSSPTTPATPCTLSPHSIPNPEPASESSCQSIPNPMPPSEASSQSIPNPMPPNEPSRSLSFESPASVPEIAAEVAPGGLHDCGFRHIFPCSKF